MLSCRRELDSLGVGRLSQNHNQSVWTVDRMDTVGSVNCGQCCRVRCCRVRCTVWCMLVYTTQYASLQCMEAGRVYDH